MKNLFISVLILSAGILLSCANGKSTHPTNQPLPPQDAKTYAIGDTAFGGIVFLVNKDGTHGLVAALQDQMVNSNYSESNEMINDPRFHDLFGKDYFDWRLPKLWEAYKMYMNLHLVNMGDFSPSGYWTCQEASSFEKMQVMNFSKGIDFSSLKTDTYRARAVRSF
jgi:hypothetical protein